MKWTIWHTISVALLGLAFAGVSVVKYSYVASPDPTTTTRPTNEVLDGLENFWETYRQATQHRTGGRSDSAAAAYEAALELRPTHNNSLYYLGHMLWSEGQPRGAYRAWKRLVEANPESARGYTQIGEARFCYPEKPLFDLGRARSAYERALDLHNEETRPMLRLGTIALLHQQSAARDQLAALHDANANNPAGALLLGYLAWQNGESARATVLFRKAQNNLERNRDRRACPLARRLTSPLRSSGKEAASSASEAYARLDWVLRQVRTEHVQGTGS